MLEFWRFHRRFHHLPLKKKQMPTAGDRLGGAVSPFAAAATAQFNSILHSSEENATPPVTWDEENRRC